jgi:hypothetical protein
MASALRLSVAPHMVALVRLAGWHKRAVAAHWLAVAPPAPGRTPWSAAIEALPELFGQAGARKGRVSVVLSNQLVRYVVVPAGEALVTDAERTDYARARLAQIHGESARAWDVRIGREPANCSRLAAAVDAGLVEGLRRALEARALRLAECRPALTAMVDAMRKRISAQAWIVAAEAKRLIVARISDGQWASYRVRPAPDGIVKIADLLAQERLLVPGTGDEGRVYISMDEDARIDAEGVQAQVLGSALRGSLAPEARLHAGLAMAGL